MNNLDNTFDDAAVHAAGQAFGRELQAPLAGPVDRGRRDRRGRGHLGP